jgi:hypothetical protein
MKHIWKIKIIINCNTNNCFCNNFMRFDLCITFDGIVFVIIVEFILTTNWAKNKYGIMKKDK